MTEYQPPTQLDEALALLGSTHQNAHRFQVDRYKAERRAAFGLQGLHHITGTMAAEHYMQQRVPGEEVIGQAFGALVSAGMAWLKAEALRTGVERHLPNMLTEANTEVARLIGAQMLQARPAPGVLLHAAIGLKTPRGTQHYDIPEPGVSGMLTAVDCDRGSLYLSHPENEQYSWEVSLFQDAKTLEPKAIVITVPSE